MANTIQILVKAKDDASRTLGQVGNRAERLGNKLRDMRGPLLAATAAIGGLGLLAGKTFAGFEQQMARVGAVSGATSGQLVQLTEVAKEMGRTTQFSATQSAEALTFMAQAGMSVTDQIGALPKVLQLAAAGSLELGQAADIVTNVMAGFGLSTEELGHANDVLTVAFTNANTDLSQLGQAFKMAGPVAKAAGISFEETAASLAIMGNAGIQASMAGTSLRGAISRLLNPSGEAADIIERMGLTVTDSAGKMLPLVNIVGQLEEKGLTASQAMTVFGQRAGPAMLALVSQGTDALAEMTNKMETSGGIAQEIAEKQLDTLSGSFLLLKSAAEGVAISVGETLAPHLRTVAGVLTDVSSFLADVNPKFIALGIAVAGGALALAGVGLVLPLIITGIGTLTGLVTGLRKAFILLHLSALGPIGLAIIGLASALVATFIYWEKFRDVIRHVFVTSGEMIGEFVNFFLDAIRGVVKGVTWLVSKIPILGDMIDKDFADKLPRLEGIAVEVFDAIDMKMTEWSRSARGAIETVKDSWMDLMKVTKELEFDEASGMWIPKSEAAPQFNPAIVAPGVTAAGGAAAIIAGGAGAAAVPKAGDVVSGMEFDESTGQWHPIAGGGAGGAGLYTPMTPSQRWDMMRGAIKSGGMGMIGKWEDGKFTGDPRTYAEWSADQAANTARYDADGNYLGQEGAARDWGENRPINIYINGQEVANIIEDNVGSDAGKDEANSA